jgi:hypothetical protein
MSDKEIAIIGEIDTEMTNKFMESVIGKNQADFYNNAKKETTVNEMLAEINRHHNKFNRLLIIEDKYVPEDCYGILIVRPSEYVNFENKEENKGQR